MPNQPFPPFLRSLPKADLPYDGLRGWLLQGEAGQVVFSESSVEVFVPEHTHGSQWGVVLAGRIDLTIDGKAGTFRRGDSYFIPAGAAHKAHIYPGFQAVDVYADRNRYKTL